MEERKAAKENAALRLDLDRKALSLQDALAALATQSEEVCVL